MLLRRGDIRSVISSFCNYTFLSKFFVVTLEYTSFLCQKKLKKTVAHLLGFHFNDIFMFEKHSTWYPFKGSIVFGTL